MYNLIHQHTTIYLELWGYKVHWGTLTKKVLLNFVPPKLLIHQQLWGFKVEEKLHWGTLTKKVEYQCTKGPNRVGVAHSSPEDWNRSSFRNIMFCSHLEFRTMDKVQKPSDSGSLLSRGRCRVSGKINDRFKPVDNAMTRHHIRCS
jgi:hypothetical protein